MLGPYLRNRTSRAKAFGLASLLALAAWGCESKGPETSDAVVVPDPTVTVPKAGSAEPAATNPSAAAEPKPTVYLKPIEPGSGSGKAEGWGTLKGQVLFGGNPPPVPTLVARGQAPKDPTVCASNEPIPSQRLLVDESTKGVKFALVYIPKPTAISDEAKKAASHASVEFDQKHCIFEPHVMAVLAGTNIELRSSDPVNHNVNVKLKNSPFNSLLAAGGHVAFKPQAAERTPGEIICDIHPWMKAWWLVLDSPYFAVTDAKGNFEIKNVPAGRQKVVVWQESVQKGGFVTPPSGEEVRIEADGTTEKSFTIDPGKILR